MPRIKYPEAAPVLSGEVQRRIDDWLDAMRWQRAANRALCSLGITHTQFLVLLGAARAIGSRRHGVSQGEIASAAGLDDSTTSILVRKLNETGYLERGPDGLDSRQYCVAMLGEGYLCVHRAAALLEAALKQLDEIEPSRR